MDLTFVIPAKNDPNGLTARCMESALQSARAGSIEPKFILIADQSDEQAALLDRFQRFRAAHPELSVRVARCRKWLHYSGVFSLGLTAAPDGDVFFLSNDMIMPPAFLRAVAGVVRSVEDAGIVRGTSAYTDSHPEHRVAPPAPLNTARDIEQFADAVYREQGARYVVDDVLSGDAVWIRRPLIDAIGVLDTRFFGYFGDVDYGVRAQKAGFKLVCAKGAWLYHLGAGHVRREASASGRPVADLRAQRHRLVNEAGKQFIDKWGIDIAAMRGSDGKATLSFADHVALARQSHKGALTFHLPDAFWADVEFI